MSTHRVGVDITRRQADAAVLAPDGSLVTQAHAPSTDVASIAKLVAGATELAGQLNVGVAADGDFPREELERRLNRPIRLAPRAACLALSEEVDGSAVADEVVFAALLGRTATGGLCVRGRIRARGYVLDSGLNKAGFTGELGVTVPEVMLRVRFGDAAATSAFDRYVQRLAQALAEVTETYSPQAIVLGGTIGRLDDLYAPLTEALIGALHRGTTRPALRKAAHGDSSVLRGAAALWPVNAQ
ncbi:MAG: ROK family protein [Myxococcota bacterium]